jgi:AcrR family transcriptional regulator
VTRAAAATRRPRARPGAGAFVDRDTVVRTAADLADRDGWHSLTMSQVAKELDRHVSSLYAHVESLADLRREVALLALDELADAVWRSVLGLVQEDALQAIADVYFDYATRHPGRAAATFDIGHDEEIAARGVRLAEPIWATFRSFGLDDAQVKVAHSVFSATITGFARRGNKERVRQAVALFVIGLRSGEWPS